MVLLVRALAFLAILAATAGPGYACVNSPPPIKEPNESEADWKRRVFEQLNERRREQQKQAEAIDFDSARHIYIGRIVKSEEVSTDGSPYGRFIAVKSLSAIKGRAPTRDRVLRTRVLTSCGFEGGGRGVWGAVGNLIIIFDRVEPYGFKNERVDSVLAKDAQDARLISALENFLIAHPEYREVRE